MNASESHDVCIVAGRAEDRFVSVAVAWLPQLRSGPDSEGRVSSARLSTSVREASSAATSPIGTLTNSTQRQLSPLVRIPPSSTPAAPPALANAPIAAPRPWTARAAISQPADWAIPPANEASENTTRPSMNMRRRPSRSATRPPSRRNPPKVSTYAFTTHDRSAGAKCRAAPIDGNATLTIEASITITNWVTASSTSARFSARGGYGGGVKKLGQPGGPRDAS